MNCSEATIHLDRVRHGDLPAPLADAVREHLETCAACTERMAEDGELARLLRERSDEIAAALPPGFSARVIQSLPSSEGRRATDNRRRLFQVFAFGALGTAAVAAAVILPIHFSQRSATEAAALAAENEAEIHLLEVSSPETHPLVFKTDEGRTVIWMISDNEFNEAGASTDAPGSSPQK